MMIRQGEISLEADMRSALNECVCMRCCIASYRGR